MYFLQMIHWQASGCDCLQMCKIGNVGAIEIPMPCYVVLLSAASVVLDWVARVHQYGIPYNVAYGSYFKYHVNVLCIKIDLDPNSEWCVPTVVFRIRFIVKRTIGRSGSTFLENTFGVTILF